MRAQGFVADQTRTGRNGFYGTTAQEDVHVRRPRRSWVSRLARRARRRWRAGLVRVYPYAKAATLIALAVGAGVVIGHTF